MAANRCEIRDDARLIPVRCCARTYLLGNGPEVWLRMQQTLDLWELNQRGGYGRIRTLRAA